MEWLLPVLSFVDGAALLAEPKEELVRIADCSDDVCKRRLLKVNTSKSKILVFEGDR